MQAPAVRAPDRAGAVAPDGIDPTLDGRALGCFAESDCHPSRLLLLIRRSCRVGGDAALPGRADLLRYGCTLEGERAWCVLWPTVF